MTSDFWNNKRVLVTGHTGFDGAWLCLWLRQMGAVVSGLSPKGKDVPNLWTLLGLDDVHNYVGDVSETMTVEDVLARENPEIIFHLAGVKRQTSMQPVEHFRTTAIGPVVLLDAITRAPSVRACVVVSSDRSLQTGLMNRDAVEYATDPFAVSLAASEAAVVAMRQTHFSSPEPGLHTCAIAIARAGNIIGGGDWTEGRLVPDIVRGCFGEDQSVLIKAPSSARSWQHVLDPLRGYLMLAEHLVSTSQDDSHGWDFFPKRDSDVTALAVADAMIASLGCGYVEFDSQEQGHSATKIDDPNLEKSFQLGWAPRLDFAQAVELTGAWYKGWQAGQPALDLCVGQLADFVARCEEQRREIDLVSAPG